MNNLPQVNPQQAVAVKTAIRDLIAQRYAILKCGQRSGKSIMIWDLIERAGYKDICMLGPSNADRLSGIALGNTVTTSLERLPSGGLVVISEPFQSPESHALFLQARRLGFPVFVIGSNGPHYTEEWKALGGQSYATWELNPLIESALAQLYKEDPIKTARDYEAF